ncbi:3-ketodihydrosphingosine reductase [Crocuta crocuta]
MDLKPVGEVLTGTTAGLREYAVAVVDGMRNFAKDTAVGGRAGRGARSRPGRGGGGRQGRGPCSLAPPGPLGPGRRPVPGTEPRKRPTWGRGRTAPEPVAWQSQLGGAGILLSRLHCLALGARPPGRLIVVSVQFPAIMSESEGRAKRPAGVGAFLTCAQHFAAGGGFLMRFRIRSSPHGAGRSQSRCEILSSKELFRDSCYLGQEVTGGSSGIGKCIAIECYKQGAFITLVARNEDKLLQAKKEIEKHSINDKQVVLCISVDVSQDYGQVENVIKQAQEKLGPVDMLVNCAGMALSGKFEDLEVSTFERLMSVNYLGSVYPSRAVITTMKERRVGRIVFVSSQAGQLGLFGFTAYSSSKFAIRGLAEALQMEVKPYNVYVTVAYPPDTDTPGYAEENKTKPLETRLISETISVCKPEQVAKQIVKDAIQGNFNSSIGSDGYMLSSLTCGMAPVTSITEGLQQVVTMGLFRTIALFYLGSFDSIVRRCMMQRAKSEVTDKTA